MSADAKTIHPEEKTLLGELGARTMRIAGGVGVVGLGLSAVLGFVQGDHLQRFFHSYLVAFAFYLTIALGALWFVILQHLVRATWSTVVRRVAEILAGTLPAMGVLFLVVLVPLLAGNDSLYFWTTAEAHDDHLVHAKLGYLNPAFFAIRAVVYFGAWIFLSRHFLRKSLEQDMSGDAAISDHLRRAAGPSMVAFGFTTCFAGFDLLMSLHPAWYSTMFGVYFFAGCALGVFAVLALASMALQRSGRLVHSITVEHYHDMGKLLFAFVFFWGYIAFSQFMLIWYADIPEETEWYRLRMFTPWAKVSILLIFGHFFFPFIMLLTRETKRRLPVLAFFCLWMLAMHYLDLFWIVMPEMTEKAGLALMDVTLFLGVGGIFVAAAARVAKDAHLIPIKEPTLSASLGFQNY